MPEDVLSHHDGIVHHDAEHDDEGEERNQVDGNSHHGHEPQSSQEGDGNSQGDPAGKAKLQKKSQDEEDEDQARPAIAEHETQAASQDHRIVLPGGDPNPLR